MHDAQYSLGTQRKGSLKRKYKTSDILGLKAAI